MRQYLTEEFYYSRKFDIRPAAHLEMFVRKKLFASEEGELEYLEPKGPDNFAELNFGLSRTVYSGPSHHNVSFFVCSFSL